ncbi:formyl transferase [Lactifluus subvellereus]|nr:formyl transferase [Lactifluus subvellereus]
MGLSYRLIRIRARVHRPLPRQFHHRFNILYFGRDEFSCKVFQNLYSASDVWQNLIIATQPDQIIGRKRDVLSVCQFLSSSAVVALIVRVIIAPLKRLGEQLSLPVATIPHVRSELKTWMPPLPFYPLPGPPPSNHLLLTASFGRILPFSLLSLFRPTHTLNVHPSALPAYRGPAPIQRAILNGEQDTAVCVIEMKRRGGIDAGDVLGSVPVTIPPGIAYGPLRDSLAQNGGELLVSVLRSILSGTERRIPQSPLTPSTPHAPFITPVDSQPDFARETAEDVVRRHLALSHHKPLTTYLPAATRTVQLHDPSVLPSGAGGTCRPSSLASSQVPPGTLLRVPMLKSEFRSLMPAKSWWDGVRRHWKDAEGCITFTNPPA